MPSWLQSTASKIAAATIFLAAVVTIIAGTFSVLGQLAQNSSSSSTTSVIASSSASIVTASPSDHTRAVAPWRQGDCADSSGGAVACFEVHESEVIGLRDTCTDSALMAYLAGSELDVLNPSISLQIINGPEPACVVSGLSSLKVRSSIRQSLSTEEGAALRYCLVSRPSTRLTSCDLPHDSEMFFKSHTARGVTDCRSQLADYIDFNPSDVLRHFDVGPVKVGETYYCKAASKGGNLLSRSLRGLRESSLDFN